VDGNVVRSGVAAGMRQEAKRLALEAKGFLSEVEGLKLFELAREISSRAPCLEIGSYCGKSSIFLAEGCRLAGGHPLFCVDHHRGSVEQQPGQQYFDPDLYDEQARSVNTLTEFMSNIRKAGLLDWVVPVVTESALMSRYWPDLSLGLVFIDGGHSQEDVSGDFNGWGPKVARAGYLCFHDIYPDPADGGQAPYHVFEAAKKTGDWQFVALVESLGILKRR
jgi:hypothetical protein